MTYHETRNFETVYRNYLKVVSDYRKGYPPRKGSIGRQTARKALRKAKHLKMVGPTAVDSITGQPAWMTVADIDLRSYGDIKCSLIGTSVGCMEIVGA